MRPIMKFTLCAFVAAVAAPAFTASADYFLKLGGVEGGAVADAQKGQIKIMSWSWGEPVRSGKISGLKFEVDVIESRDGDQGGATLKSSKMDKGTPMAGSTIGKAIGNASTDGNEAAAQAGGKRQHGWVTVSKPLARGAVMVKGRLPGCTVGATYPDAVLQTAEGRYELQDVVVSSCAGDSVSVNYAKVMVRGWNPEKKEQ